MELRCCKGVVLYPVRLLAAKGGNRIFGDVLARLRCDSCGGKPAPVYLCTGHRQPSAALHRIGRSNWCLIRPPPCWPRHAGERAAK